MSEDLDNNDFVIPLEMQHTYWLRRQVDFDTLEKALQCHNIDIFHKIGHQLKGNAITFGFADLSSLGERLEKVSSQDFPHSAAPLLTEFKYWINKTALIFNSK